MSKEQFEDHSKFNDDEENDDRSIRDLQYPKKSTIPVWKKLDALRQQKIREILQPFGDFDHRLEKSLTIKGVQYIEDSRSSTRNSLWFALEKMDKPTILIMGGLNSNTPPPPELYKLIKEKVKTIIGLGKYNKRVEQTFDTLVPYYDTHSMHDAVTRAYEIAQPGEVVLLSPGAASFDLFKNLEDRGEQFKKELKNL